MNEYMILDSLNFSENCILAAKQFLRDKTFWNYYTVKTSPGDGHCLLYSISTSYNAQFSYDLNICYLSLLSGIHNEILNHYEFYEPFIPVSGLVPCQILGCAPNSNSSNTFYYLVDLMLQYVNDKKLITCLET